MDKFFLSLFFLIKKNAGLTFGLFVSVTAVLIFGVSQINFDEDISKLIPKHEKNKTFQEVLETISFSDKIIISITARDSSTLDEATYLANDFTDSLHRSTSPYIASIQGKINTQDTQEGLDFVYQNIPFFLHKSDYDSLQTSIKEGNLDTIVSSYKKSLNSSLGLITRRYTVRDPFGLTYMGLKNLKQVGNLQDFTLKNNYLASKKGNTLFLFISPNTANSQTGKNKKFVDQLNAIKTSLNKKYQGKAHLDMYGGILIADANATQIQNDIKYTVGIAMLILLSIFIFFYKKWIIPLVIFLPTVCGGLVALALLSILRDEISMIALGIGSVLLGITLDYALHILTHLRKNGAINQLYEEVTKPILMSSLTTSLAFFCLIFIDSEALQDLGIFAGVSVLSAAICALIVIPQLYTAQHTQIKQHTSIIERLAKFPLHYNRYAIILLGFFFIIGIFSFNEVDFNKDLDSLNYISPELRATEHRLDSLSNLTAKSVYLVAFSKNKESAIQTNERVYEMLKHDNTIASYSSLGSIIQSEKTQQKKIKLWEDFWQKNSGLQNDLKKITSKYSVKTNTFDRFLKHTQDTFTSPAIEDFKRLKIIPVQDFVASKGNLFTITSVVKIKHDKLSQFKDKFAQLNNLTIIDRQEVNENLLGNLKIEFNQLLFYSLIAVVSVLFLFFRNIKLVLVTIIPLIVSWAITLGLMGLFHLSFNVFNIIITSFIFGLGIDYSIFITQGLLNKEKYGTSLTLPKTSILLSVLTTLLGMGVLIFAKHPALHSIAAISIIGILVAVCIAFILQPLLFTILMRKNKI